MTDDPSQNIVLDGEGPPHRQIERALRSRIQSGLWPPGYRIPPEHDLVTMLGCSRATISKVLSSLAGAHLIVRRRRHGSFVRERTDSHAVIGTLDVRAKIEASGQRYTFEILERAVVSGADAPIWPEASPEETLLKLLLVHKGDERTEVLEERLVRVSVVPDILGASFETEAPNHWLLARLPCTRLINTIRAATPDRRWARLLGLAANEPVLLSERRAWSELQPVTWVRLIFPGHRSEFVGEFNPLSSSDST